MPVYFLFLFLHVLMLIIYVLPRPALKDCAPLTDDHFAVYHSPASFGIGDYSPKWPKGMDSDEFEEPHPYLLEYLSAD